MGTRPKVTRKATDEQLVQAYADLQSVHAVGARFRMNGSSVHERLVKLGVHRPSNRFTEADKARLLLDYEQHANAETLDALALSMGRTKQFICRKAGELGLTDQARQKPESKRAKRSATAKKLIAENGHPRGMLGKTHSDETRAILSQKHALRFAEMSEEELTAHVLACVKGRIAAGNTIRPRPETTWKAGWREIGGRNIYYRSRWEANFARYLEWQRVRGAIEKWEHEPETFWFEGIRRGAVSYLPDFRVTNPDGSILYYEVKGWMDDRSKTKIARMARYFPQIRLVLIDSKAYRALALAMASQIEGWEE